MKYSKAYPFWLFFFGSVRLIKFFRFCRNNLRQ